jgi:hypothetical protein
VEILKVYGGKFTQLPQTTTAVIRFTTESGGSAELRYALVRKGDYTYDSPPPDSAYKKLGDFDQGEHLNQRIDVSSGGSDYDIWLLLCQDGKMSNPHKIGWRTINGTWRGELYVAEKGKDSNDGKAPDNAVATLKKALEILKDEYASEKKSASALCAIHIAGEVNARGEDNIIITGASYPPIVLLDNGGGTLRLISKGAIITAGSGGNLTIGGDLHLAGMPDNITALVHVAFGKLTLEGKAVIRDNTNVIGAGGGVYLQAGEFIMTGGEIRGNKATDNVYGGGGGVWALANSVFTMKGGKIINNESYGVEINLNMGAGGGGVGLSGSPTFTMAGSGEIRGNSAVYGGGVFFLGWDEDDGPSFYMHGGTIAENTAVKEGGGVYAGNIVNSHNENLACFEKTGGVITGGGDPYPNKAGGSPQAVGGDRIRSKTAGSGDGLDITKKEGWDLP